MNDIIIVTQSRITRFDLRRMPWATIDSALGDPYSMAGSPSRARLLIFRTRLPRFFVTLLAPNQAALIAPFVFC